MVCAYMPDGCTFNGIKNILPDAYLETTAVGDILDDDTINPLYVQSNLPLLVILG